MLLAESTPGSRLIAIDRIDMTFVTVPNFKGRAKSAAKGWNNTQYRGSITEDIAGAPKARTVTSLSIFACAAIG